MATLAELWAGPDLKHEHATYFWQRMQDSLELPPRTSLNSGTIVGTAWHRSFFADFDAFLAMARSVPELIQACFGIEETPPKRVRDWFDRLDPGEKLRRKTFTAEFEPTYRAFRGLPLSTRRTVILYRVGSAEIQVVVTGRFGLSAVPATDIVSGAESRPRSSDANSLSPLPAVKHDSPIESKWTNLQVAGRPFYDEVVAYLEHVSNMIAAAHKLAAEVHGSQSLTAPFD